MLYLPVGAGQGVASPPAPCLHRMFTRPERTAQRALQLCSMSLGGREVTCRPWWCLESFDDDWKIDKEGFLSSLLAPGSQTQWPRNSRTCGAGPTQSSPLEMPSSTAQGRTAPAPTALCSTSHGLASLCGCRLHPMLATPAWPGTSRISPLGRLPARPQPAAPAPFLPA